MPGRISSIHSLETTDKRPHTVSDGIVPKAPLWLNANAKKIYKATAKEIVALGIAGRADANVLAIFSMQYDRLMTLSEKNDGELPSQRLLNDLSTQCLSLIKELGISPSARAKLRIAKVETSDDLDDYMNEND